MAKYLVDKNQETWPNFLQKKKLKWSINTWKHVQPNRLWRKCNHNEIAFNTNPGSNLGLPHCRQILYQLSHKGFPGSSVGKKSACSAGDLGSIPGSRRSPGEGKGYPLQYSCLENSMGRGAWWAEVHGVAKNRVDWTTNTHTQSYWQKFEHLYY